MKTNHRALGSRLLQRELARFAAWTERRFTAPSGDAAAPRPRWMRATACVMAVVMYFAPAVLLADATAHAAPIVDPRAPIPFQPTITQTSTGVPTVNITAPNANGISLNSYQSFNVDSQGLVLNNSVTGGTPLLGGTLGANPNLAGRTATTIINQVTSTGPASSLLGPLEVFGNPATVVISNPNGIVVNGMGLTNMPGLVLTTGAVQFLGGVGGTSTDFAHAGALAYSVNSGNISINGPAGVNGPGAGIAGTVGNIDLIGQTLSVNAPLQADQRVNLIAGNQLVTPATAGSTGTSYGTAANGAVNTAAAIGNGGIAIDASQFGSVTSGQVFIVSTAAGMGVNTQGALVASAGNVVVSSNGDIDVGSTFANQNVNLTSAGNTTVSGNGLANQNYTITANGDIKATGAVSAGQNASLTAGGNLDAASVAANGNAALNAGNSMTVGSLSGQNLSLQTSTGDITLNSTLSAPGTIAATAGRDLTVNGAVQGGDTVGLTAARNATVNGNVSGSGDTAITAQTGTANIAGNVQSNGALTVASQQGTSLGGTAQAQGPVSISAQSGSVTGHGNLASSQDAVSLTAGQDIGLTGSVQAGSSITARAGGNASLGGTVTAPGAIAVTAGGDATLGGNATSGSTLTVTAGGDASINGAAASVGDMQLTATNGSLSTTGSVTTSGNLSANGKQGVKLGGDVYSQGNARIASGSGSVTVAGTLTTPGTVTVNAGQDATVSGNVHSGQNTTISATRDANLNGGLEVDGSGNAAVTAGRDINGAGTIDVANDTTLSAGRNLGVTGAIQTGNNLDATAGTNLSVGATTAVGSATLTATSGSATLGGDALSGGALNVTAGSGIAAQGNVQSLADINLDAKGGDLTTSGTLSAAGNATLASAGALTLNGQTTVSKDATLSGANITTQGLAVGGNLVANATGNLDTSAGQLNAAFDSSAPALSVNGNATLSGTNVTTANAVIGGTYSATATNTLTTGGTAAYQADATLAGGTVTNVGTQEAAGNLTVSGSTVANQGAFSSLRTMAVKATNLDNSGTIYGPATTLTVSGSTTNTGGLLATDSLNLTTASLNNSNGLIFAGDLNNPAAATGDTSVTVTGGDGSFNNTGGKILSYNVTTLALPNQRLDPSAATFGTVNGGNGLNLSALAVNNTGTWTLPATAVNVSATQDISNSGTINQGTGSLALAGQVTNTGTINGDDVTINGSLANQAGATVQASDAFTLNGSGTNAGTVEATNALSISGSAYDNSNGTTKAGNSSSAAGSGNLNVTLSGDLTNAGGTLTATSNASITAATTNNSAASTSTTTTTTTTVVNAPLLMSTVIGTETVYGIQDSGKDGGYLTLVQATVPATLGGVLSVTGIIPSRSDWDNGAFGQYVGVTAPQSAPVATSGTVQYVEVPTVVSYGGNTGTAQTENLWYVQNSAITGAVATQTLTIPTVTETTTTTGGASGSSSVIAAGNNLGITASTLNNQGGTVSAGHDVNLNVQSLSNGGSSYTSTVTDAVDTASLNAFLTALRAMPGGVSVWGSGNASGAYNCSGSGPNASCAVGPATPPTSFTIDAPGTATTQSVSSSVTVQGATGQIVAGHNLNLSGGNLTNAGTLAAANDVHITSASFTNQGTNTGTMTTTAGCAPGFSGCATASTINPNSQTYSYQQNNATVTAGNDIVIASNTINNTYGNLVAKHNVVIGGVGTAATDGANSPSSLTQAASVTNTSGSIEAGNDVDINAATLTNTIAAPVQIHQNYGSGTPFTGCTSNCEAYVDVQSAAPATITANHDVNLSAATFSNTGSLVTALNNVTINASSSASTNNQYLYAYWSSGFAHYNTQYTTFGCANNPSLCQQLYGSAYSSSAAQDPAGLPSSVGLPNFVPGTIQAANTLSVTSPTLTNTGNVLGQSIALSGSQLVNGLTNPNVYTPPPAVSGQVITLGPLSVPGSATTTVNAAGQVTNLNGQPTSVTGAAGLPSNTPIGTQTVGKPVAPTVGQVGVPQGTTVKTADGQTVSVSYLSSNPAADVMGDISPASLVAALPANLRPGNVPFYYDPYTENQQIEQAALQATGQASFYSTTSATDSTSQASIEDQDKEALYGAALQYAKQNNVALGTQLSQAQLAQINAPMLWYVQETVPEPGCTATGNGACPTVQALMPEVLLPQNFASVNADGEITGTNVALNYANSILNTGSVSADNLTVDTASLTNEQRSTNIGTIYQNIDTGVAQTTGTVVQQGGFMSAMNYDMNVQSLNQIGGVLEQVNADGSVNQTATSQLLANLKGQLGGSFTQSTVSNDLNTTVIADGGMGLMMVFEMAIIVALSVVTAGAASAAIAGTQVAAADAGMATLAAGGTIAEANAAAGILASSVFAAGGVANAAIAGAAAGLVGSAASDLLSTGSLNLGDLMKGAAVGGLTAGLTSGITLDSSGFGFSLSGSPDSLASLAGVQNIGNSLVPQAGASTAGSLPLQTTALAADAVTRAGVQTIVDGGSFLDALRNDAVSNVAAVGAYAIGNEAQALTQDLGNVGGEAAYVGLHGLLGCAASAAVGTGCAGGAIGGATSAVLSPYVIGQIDPTGAPPTPDQAALTTTIAMLAGGGIAGALGQNVTGAATSAANEALNNALEHVHLDEAGKPGQQAEGEKDVVSIVPQSGGAIDEEEAGEVPVVGKGTAAAAAAGATNSVQFSPINQGPLSTDVANTFRSGTYTQSTLTEATTLYRVTSPGGNPTGSYWTSTSPTGPLQSVIDSALDQNWGNSATNVFTATVPAGTTIYQGLAAPQRGLVGGGVQIYIPQVNPSWIIGK
jgi:filamentous hemagglutinin